jgi:hypothetical protein
MDSVKITCNIPVSVGELYDKYSILLIKQKKIVDNDKLVCINNEINLLKNIISSMPFFNEELLTELININTMLWDIEDNIRIKEKHKEFDIEFISLARNVYFTNDKRFEVKTRINQLYNSDIFEVKSYEYYL